MPMPAPPGGTMGVIFSRGRKVIRSKKAATWGCSSIWLRRILKNSALPGTNWGRTYRFSWLGFFPSRFSQLYSIRPTQAMSSSSFCRGSRSSLVSFISCPMVLGLRTPIFRAPVFRIVALDALELGGHPVGNHGHQLRNLGPGLVHHRDGKGQLLLLQGERGGTIAVDVLSHVKSPSFPPNGRFFRYQLTIIIATSAAKSY